MGMEHLLGPFLPSSLAHHTMQSRACVSAGDLLKELLVCNQFGPITYDMGNIWEYRREN